MPEYENYRSFSEGLLKELNISELDRKLLQLCFDGLNDGEALKDINRCADIETETYGFNCTLSAMGQKYGWDRLRADWVPRLQGVQRKLAAENMHCLSLMSGYIKQLNELSIPVMVTGDAALKLGPLCDIHRRMSCVELLVSRKHMCQCLRTAENVYSGKKIYSCLPQYFTVRLSDSCTLAVRRTAFSDAEKPDDTVKIFHRGTVLKKNGIEVLVPSCEDLYLMKGVSLVRGVIAGRKTDIYGLTDLWELNIRCSGLSCEKTEQYAEQLHLTVWAGLLAGITHELAGDVLLHLRQEDEKPPKRAVKRILNRKRGRIQAYVCDNYPDEPGIKLGFAVTKAALRKIKTKIYYRFRGKTK